VSSSRSGKSGISARQPHLAIRRRRPSTSSIRHLVICRMQIWRPASTDSVPVHQAPQQTLDPLIHMVLTESSSSASLPIHPWWEDTVETAISAARLGERQLPLPSRSTLGMSASTTVAAPGSPNLATLSAREQEILLLVAEGLPNKAIADRLIIAASTVKWYLKHIYLKLDVHNRAQAIACLHAATEFPPNGGNHVSNTALQSCP
jgi:DNA-binding CsgD family transcriptional regulator